MILLDVIPGAGRIEWWQVMAFAVVGATLAVHWFYARREQRRLDAWLAEIDAIRKRAQK